jgi:hypothetical protein
MLAVRRLPLLPIAMIALFPFPSDVMTFSGAVNNARKLPRMAQLPPRRQARPCMVGTGTPA